MKQEKERKLSILLILPTGFKTLRLKTSGLPKAASFSLSVSLFGLTTGYEGNKNIFQNKIWGKKRKENIKPASSFYRFFKPKI